MSPIVICPWCDAEVDVGHMVGVRCGRWVCKWWAGGDGCLGGVPELDAFGKCMGFEYEQRRDRDERDSG